MAEKHHTDFEQEQRREEARQAFGEEAGARGAKRLEGAHSIATEGVHMVRDVASDTVRAVGDVGNVAIDTAHDLLVGVADGLRDVITHIIPFGTRRQPPPGQPPSERP